MRRTLLIAVVLSLALGAIGSATPPPTAAATKAAAASSKTFITLPTAVTRGRLTAARISLPGNVAALDGRVLVSSKAAEVIGVAVPRTGISLMPVAVKGGFAFGAYNLHAAHGRTVVDVVLLPKKSGRIGIRVTIDSMADAHGRRITGSVSGQSAARTLGVAEASRKAGTRKGSKVYASGAGSASFGTPLASGRVTPLHAARGLRSITGTSKISLRDQDYARAGWTQARAKGGVCDASAALDPNGDGCADIVDLEATLVAHGRRAGLSAIRPLRTAAPRSTSRQPTTTLVEGTPSASEAPPADPVASDAPPADPAASDAPAASPEPVSGDTSGDTSGGDGKSATGKSMRAERVTSQTTSDATGKTFTVNSTADTVDAVRGDGKCADANGNCTLRAAIAEADFLTGDDRIEFNLPGTAPVTIQITSRLPYITSRNGTVTIDGFSQPGSSVNTAEFGSNAVEGVEIRGNGGSAKEVGLMITSPGNTVRGLVMDNLYRAIFLDGADAHDNRIIGNEIGFTRTGANAAGQNFAIVINTGANNNHIGTPVLANRNVIGNYTHAVENFGSGTDGNVIQNNVLCIGPTGARAPCSTGIDHNFGPKNDYIGGDGQYERNVIGPTYLQGIEYSHGWNGALPPRVDNGLPYQINGNSVVGNWVGFRMDGSYDPNYRSGLNFSSADNGQGINVYDGSNYNTVRNNYVAATYDGITVMAPNAVGNIIKDNIIGVAPNGNPAPLTGWGVKMRWQATHEVISGNIIRNAALGGVGLVQDTVYNVRISRNIISDTNGPAIYLAPQSGSTTKGADNLQAPPVITSATTDKVRGTGVKGSTVEVYRADRATGLQGLPVEYLGNATVASDGTWKVDISGVSAGQRVTALQIRTDDNTSTLAPNVDVVQAAAPPQSGDVILSDDFGRTLSGSWGNVDQGGAWALTGTAADFSVNGAAAQITAAAAATRETRVSVASTADVDITGTIALDKVPAGTSAYAYVLARANGNNAYRAAIRVSSGGLVYLQLKKAISNVESNIGSEVALGLSLTPGSPVGFRFRLVGSNLSFRAWDATGAEPGSWTVTGSDSTAGLTGPGSVGLRTYFGSATSNGPITVSLDGFRVLVP